MKTQNLHLFILLGLISCFGWTNIAQAQEYIYFDLAAGNVEITTSKYTGYRWKTVNGTTTSEKVTGTHYSSNQYYVYQSQDTYPSAKESYKTTTGNQDGTIVIPVYDEVTYGEQTWKEYITGNNDVEAIVTNWPTSAASVYKTACSNTIEITTSSAKSVDMVIDGIWSDYNSSTIGSGTITVSTSSYLGETTLRLKGDSRARNINYSCAK